jgi:DNA segregation ATPase FtsK/SpoIIIE-like protein
MHSNRFQFRQINIGYLAVFFIFLAAHDAVAGNPGQQQQQQRQQGQRQQSAPDVSADDLNQRFLDFLAERGMRSPNNPPPVVAPQAWQQENPSQQLPLQQNCARGQQCPPPQNAGLARECVETIINAGCLIDSGQRANICREVASPFAITAIRAAFRQTCSTTDSTFVQLAAIRNDLAAQCVLSIVRAGCLIDSRRRASLCRQTQSYDAVVAVARAFEQTCSTTDSTLATLVQITR